MEIIVGKKSGFCYGVKRAYEGALENLNRGKLYCLGELVHNAFVIKSLEEKGITFIDDINESNIKNARLLIRAHGVKKEVYDECKKRNIEVIDYTCPNVLKIHDIVKDYSNNGYFIILCGNKSHPENIGTISYAGEFSSVIENVEDVDNILNYFYDSKLNKLLLISQTTFSVEKFNIIKNELENKIDKNYNIVIKNTICNATKLNQDETDKISKEVDYIIVVGGKNSSNTQKLYNVAKKNLENVSLLEDYKDLDIEKIKKYQKIGIVYGASTPDILIEEIVNKLK